MNTQANQQFILSTNTARKNNKGLNTGICYLLEELFLSQRNLISQTAIEIKEP